MESIDVNRSNAQPVHNLQKKIVRSRLESVKVVLRSLMLGILLGFLSRRVAMALFYCYSSSKPMSTDAWQSLNRAFSRHLLFFIVNAVVLLVLVPSGFFSQSQGAQGARTAHYDFKIKLRAPAQQWKTSDSGRFQNRPNLLEPETEGKELSLALVKMTQDQTKQCLLPKQQNTTGHMSSTKTMHSPVVHRNDLINGELEDLNGRIEAFIAKVRREMKQQERHDAPLDRYRSGR